jgi:hypothetical protein
MNPPLTSEPTKVPVIYKIRPIYKEMLRELAQMDNRTMSREFEHLIGAEYNRRKASEQNPTANEA